MTLEDVVGYAVAMSHANVVGPMVLAAQPIVATNVAKRQLLRRRVLKDQLAASLKDEWLGGHPPAGWGAPPRGWGAPARG